MSSPDSRDCATSLSTYSRLGCGTRAGASSGRRSTPTSRRISDERGPARLLDGLQRLALALLILTEQSAHGGRLNRHDADGVADDVVQLARDACALLGNGGARLYLSFQLESLGALAQLFRLT